MTFNGVIALILRYFTEFASLAFMAHCVKVVEDIPKRSAQKCSPKHVVLAIYHSGDMM